MNVLALLEKYLEGKETGQLVVKFEGVPHLCKISIDQGSAVYMSLGKMPPREAMQFAGMQKPVQANFIPGVPARKRLSAPMNDELLSTFGGTSGEQSTPAADASPAVQVQGAVSPSRIEAVVDAFIDVVGPLGPVLAEKKLSGLGHAAGRELGAAQFSKFIEMLVEEIPSDYRSQFLKAIGN